MPSSVLNYYHTINFSIANYMEKEEDAAEYLFCCITDKYEDQKSFQYFIGTPYVCRRLKK